MSHAIEKEYVENSAQQIEIAYKALYRLLLDHKLFHRYCHIENNKSKHGRRVQVRWNNPDMLKYIKEQREKKVTWHDISVELIDKFGINVTEDTLYCAMKRYGFVNKKK
jgi:hypothetical protein